MKEVPMPISHRIANNVWNKVFNWRHKSDIKDVNGGLVAFKLEVLEKMDWHNAPKGYAIDAWMKKEFVRLSRENGYKISQMPVKVNYFKSEIEAPFKVRFKKYFKMFFTVLKECLKA